MCLVDTNVAGPTAVPLQVPIASQGSKLVGLRYLRGTTSTATWVIDMYAAYSVDNHLSDNQQGREVAILW